MTGGRQGPGRRRHLVRTLLLVVVAVCAVERERRIRASERALGVR